MSSIDKSKNPNLEQKMNKENSLEISDPVLKEFYKGLNEVQQGIIKKLPEERRIPFLNFAKEAKEKDDEFKILNDLIRDLISKVECQKESTKIRNVISKPEVVTEEKFNEVTG